MQKMTRLFEAGMLMAFMTFLALPVFAAENGIIRYKFTSYEPDAQVEDVLYYGLAVELSNAGYSSSKTEKSASYLLTVAYANLGESADVTLTLQDNDGKKDTRAEISAVIGFDEGFDGDVADAVARLLEVAALGEEKPSESAPSISGLFSSDLVRAKDMLRTDKTRRFELVGSLGSPVYFGDFSEYATFGALGSLQASALFLSPKRSLSVGARATSSYVFLAENVSGGPVLFSTIGPNVQVGVGSSQFLRLAGCLSGGAAIISLKDGETFLHKTDAYVDLGVQFGFPVRKDLFLGGDLRGLLIFEPGLPILGAELGLSLAKEF